MGMESPAIPVAGIGGAPDFCQCADFEFDFVVSVLGSRLSIARFADWSQRSLFNVEARCGNPDVGTHPNPTVGCSYASCGPAYC